MIVVDTQLLVYITMPVPESKLARSVLGKDNGWAVPFLWRSEFRNAMLGHVRNDRASILEASVAFDWAHRLVAGREHHVDTPALFDLSTGNKVTAYDLEFATLARTLGVKLVTFDKQLLAELPAIAVHPAQFVA